MWYLTILFMATALFAATLARSGGNGRYLNVYKDCGSKLSTVKKVFIRPCPYNHEENMCEVTRGVHADIEWTFTPTQNIPEVRIETEALAMGFKVPFPQADSNGCHYVKCPLVAGQEVVFKKALTIPTWAPAINVVAFWRLLTKDNEVIACSAMPIKTL